MRTLAVVGGGAMGLSTAWRAAEAGWSVTVFDPNPGAGASWVAGGMLAPYSEGWPGEEEVLRFGAAGLAHWPRFAEQLAELTGESVFTAEETLTVALDSADVTDLRTIADWVGNTLPAPGPSGADTPPFSVDDSESNLPTPGLRGGHTVTAPRTALTMERTPDTAPTVERSPNTAPAVECAPTPEPTGGLRLLDRRGVRTLEPGLARTVRAGLLASTEPAIDNRTLLRGLQTACARAGVEIRTAEVTDLAELPHDRIVLAAGAASARLWPGLPVRPVKGEILRLRQRPGTPAPPTRVVRARVHGRPVYLVPRADGVVIGATQYEVGFDAAVTVAGVRDLIADAEAVLPGISDYELTEASAGFRPATPDNLPLIGPLDERVLAATGNGRNGMLTVALTADAVLAELDGTPLPEAAVADPGRFPAAQPLSSAGGVR